MHGQIKTKGIKGLVMAKKTRIRALWEEEVTGTAMAYHLGRQGRLGRQKLKKEYLAGSSVSTYAQEDHWHHQEWGRHALRTF
jgi:hypothetical protein